MTKTNQAFIKAYRQDAAQTAPTAPAGGAVRPAAARHSVLAGAGNRPQSATAEKRPLSSFIAGAGIARLSSEPAEGEFLRPGTSIASFEWPSVCRALAHQCGPQLDRIADLLVEQADASRSLVGVISLFPGGGATTITACLAARLAGRGRRIILVDGNFHNPHLAQLLDVVPTAGWQEVLKHGAPLADAVIRANEDRLDLLALGPKSPPDAQQLVAGLQAVVTAGVLRHAYDLVLIDAGPFFDSPSQATVLELVRNMGVDAVLGITRSRPADSRDLERLSEQLGRSGCEFLGTIENRAVSRGSRVQGREPE